jgi:hypothetical protein
MRILIAFFFALTLGACASAPPPAPIDVTIEGPRFAASRFDCGRLPAPPDPAIGEHGGSAAARYEEELAQLAGCEGRKLQSLKRELGAAGQVAQ